MTKLDSTASPASVLDYFKLHFIVIIWGFTAILGKWMTIPAVETVLYRTLIAAFILAFMVKRKEWKLPKKIILQLLMTGVIVGAHWITFFAAAKVANVSICLVGLSTASLWTAFIEPLFNKRKIKLYEVGLGLVIILGLYVILQTDLSSDMVLGLILGIIAAILAALFSTINGKFTHVAESYTITVLEMSGAAFGIILFLPFYSAYFTNGAGIDMVLKNNVYFNDTLFLDFVNLLHLNTDFVLLFVLAVICTVYAYSVSVELLRRLSVFMTNLTINLEPVYGIVLAAFFFDEHEKMDANFYLGASIILLSVLSYPIFNYVNKKIKMKKQKLV
ncbi:EamA-like transporter family [Bernardetia litoralis DSM 6794]|uniref:EamA-like transporter family n=1 Tax=Bernardetia litoralis (strain ATCC 23117 / DSM 6794 / NBRC 15988 / NCIMB 1366 / Fx l1 / Sio-4) TaxID=880071 RepID=I4AMM6_BERLS|nr:DMT family transporter [Bernardetia litoralis]AFM05211.1 EamA-like transporter family [Bernardetia litoralis DSM 6794]